MCLPIWKENYNFFSFLICRSPHMIPMGLKSPSGSGKWWLKKRLKKAKKKPLLAKPKKMKTEKWLPCLLGKKSSFKRKWKIPKGKKKPFFFVLKFFRGCQSNSWYWNAKKSSLFGLIFDAGKTFEKRFWNINFCTVNVEGERNVKKKEKRNWFSNSRKTFFWEEKRRERGKK